MKDIVENRKQIDLFQKVRLAYLVLTENGFFWTAYLALYYASSSAAEWSFGAMNQLREKHRLPGVNSTAMNYEIWRNWKWEHSGEEWTYSLEWKNSLIENILLKYMKNDGFILEVGPGAGRWTEVLQKIAKHLIAVDISDRCIEICKTKFSNSDNTEFVVNDGTKLPFVADGSIDSVWSFDVFVHINEKDAEQYIKEFSRIMKPGGNAAINHGQEGSIHGGVYIR